jgi:hypothetical protein
MDTKLLKEFVAEVLVVCKNDHDGLTYGLEEKALEAGLELGMTTEELKEIIING